MDDGLSAADYKKGDWWNEEEEKREKESPLDDSSPQAASQI